MSIKRLFPWLAGLGALALVVGALFWLIPVLWCWGYFGRDNLVFQYWWYCNCPINSEAARYAPYRVLVSACLQPYLMDTSNDGDYVLIRDNIGRREKYLLRINVANESYDYFPLGGYNAYNRVWLISNAVVLVRTPNKPGKYVFSYLNDSVSSEIADVVGHEQIIDPASSYWHKLSQSPLIIFIDSYIILGTDNNFDPHLSIVVETLGPETSNYVQDQLDKLNITYIQITGRNTLINSISPDGRFSATKEGIYWVDNPNLVVEAWQPNTDIVDDRLYPKVWSRDSRKVIYGDGRRFCIIDDPVILGCNWPVPQPILILDVPRVHWPTSTPTP